MAISAEAYEYLREIEMIPCWTRLPDNDERIMKLRLLFNVSVVESLDEKPVRKHNNYYSVRKHNNNYSVRKPETGRFKGRPIRATKDGKSIIFEDVTQCAEILGLKKATIHSALREDHVSHVTSGYFLERLDTVNSTN